MAFDFVSYIKQQVEQQHPSLLADEDKIVRKRYVRHLIGLQLAELHQSIQKDADDTYDKIKQQDDDWLVQITQKRLDKDSEAVAFFKPIWGGKLNTCSHKVAKVILNELSQLDENSGLGIEGIEELLSGQYVWLQDRVLPWFWDTVGHPEFKQVEAASAESDAATTEDVMKEFNQLIQQQRDAHTQKHEHSVATEQTIPKPQEIGTVYKILAPLIALFILIFLFQWF